MYTFRFTRRYKPTTKQQLVELLTKIRGDLAKYLIADVPQRPFRGCLVDVAAAPAARLYHGGIGLTLAGLLALLDVQLAQVKDVRSLECPAEIMLDLGLVTSSRDVARRFGFRRVSPCSPRSFKPRIPYSRTYGNVTSEN